MCDSVGGLFTFQALCQYSTRDDLSSNGSSNFDCGDDDTFSIDSARSLNFRFAINGVFTLGSPIGIVALKQKMSAEEKGK